MKIVKILNFICLWSSHYYIGSVTYSLLIMLLSYLKVPFWCIAWLCSITILVTILDYFMKHWIKEKEGEPNLEQLRMNLADPDDPDALIELERLIREYNLPKIRIDTNGKEVT